MDKLQNINATYKDIRNYYLVLLEGNGSGLVSKTSKHYAVQGPSFVPIPQFAQKCCNPKLHMIIGKFECIKATGEVNEQVQLYPIQTFSLRIVAQTLVRMLSAQTGMKAFSISPKNLCHRSSSLVEVGSS